MKLAGLPSLGAPQTPQSVRFGAHKTDTGTLLLPAELPADIVEIGKTSSLVLVKPAEDPQVRQYREFKSEIGHGIQLMTFQFLQAIPEIGPLIENRMLSPITALQVVPEDRQVFVAEFFRRLHHYYAEPALEILEKTIQAQAKKELPNHSKGEIKDLLAGKDVKVSRKEILPKALVLQAQKEGLKTIDQVIKDALLAGYQEMKDYQTNNSPEIAAREMEERYEVTSKKYNPRFAYL